MHIDVLDSISVPAGALAAEADALEISLYVELERTRERAESLLRRARAAGEPFVAARAELALADIVSRGGEVEAALDVQRAFLRHQGVPWAGAIQARAHCYLASSYFRLGLWALCQESSGECFAGLDEHCPPLWHAEHLMVLAMFTSYDRPGADFALFEMALARTRELDAPDMLLAVLNNFAWTAHQAPYMRERCRELVGEMSELVDADRATPTAAVLDTLGWLRLGDGRLQEAERLFMLGLAHEESTEPDGQAALMLHLAVLRRTQGRHDEARALLQEGRAAALGTGSPEFAVEALRELATLDAERGAWRSAYEHLRGFVEEQAAMTQEESGRRAAVLQSIYTTEAERRQRRHYEELARRDALTGLYNRRHLESEAPRALTAGPVTVAMLDLDHFKTFNDRFSHETGDALLREFSELLTEAAREGHPDGFAVRLGGEEFLLLAPGSTVAQVRRSMESLRARVAGHGFAALPAGERMTVSVGVAVSEPTDGSLSALLSRADARLYAAKRAGRNRVLGATG